MKIEDQKEHSTVSYLYSFRLTRTARVFHIIQICESVNMRNCAVLDKQTVNKKSGKTTHIFVIQMLLVYLIYIKYITCC